VSVRTIAVAALVVSVVAGTLADRPPSNPAITLGGYRVLAADFHTHSSTWSDGGLTPFGLVLEAERQRLDVIAITGHMQVADAKAGRWFSRRVGGPTVLVGEEIVAPAHHVIAAGIHDVVSWRLDVASTADEIHRQGGIAIAAHPLPDFWPAYDDAAMRRLDGAEICHPAIFSEKDAQENLERFAARGNMAAIGSSDFHGGGPMGACRTYVFARDNSEEAILEAVRAHRTVVYGKSAKPYGDPALIKLAADDGRIPALEAARAAGHGGWLDWISRIAGVSGLAGLVAFRRDHARRHI